MPGAGLQGQRADHVKPGPEAAGTSQVCMFRWQFRIANRLAPPRPEVLKPCVWWEVRFRFHKGKVVLAGVWLGGSPCSEQEVSCRLWL